MTGRETKLVELSIDRSVFKNVPSKQAPRNHGVRDVRYITDDDFWRMGQAGDSRRVERIITGLTDKLFADVGAQLIRRLVNAGPHVVDFSVRTRYSEVLRAQILEAASPIIAAKTYGAEVSRSDLARSVLPPGHAADKTLETMAAFQPKPSLWRRFVAWVDEGIQYDGPRGWIDA